MKRLLLTLALLVTLQPAWSAGGDLRRWEHATVNLELTRKQYDYLQPWSRRAQTVLKAGVVVGPRQLLTTAADLADRTVIRAQRQGRGAWYNTTVTWADYAANVALLTVEDPAFWTGLKPVALARKIPRDGNLRIMRWRGGSLEVRKAEFTRFSVSNPNVGEAAHVVLELNAEIEGVGWGEPAVEDNHLVGLVFSQNANVCQVLPAPYIQTILDAHARAHYPGIGYFDFTWQPTENPETLRYFKVPNPDQGVVIIHVPPQSPSAELLKPRDVLLEVDGFPIDNQGDYTDPLYGHLMLENLSTRKHWAGESIPLKIWRQGAALTVDYRLPPLKHAARLVPEAAADQPPEYLIAGGLVFQPLTRNYLRSWGQDWERSAPFRLAFFRNEDPTPERPALLVLSLVLPDYFNLGYHDVRNLVLEKVNGRRVSYLPELVDALKQPQDGFHVLEFLKGETLQRIVLEAAQLDPTTQRVLERYGIEQDRQIAGAAEHSGGS